MVIVVDVVGPGDAFVVVDEIIIVIIPLLLLQILLIQTVKSLDPSCSKD